ncbi:NAD-dependent deacylase [Candidatus Omnitrophota bacterium]
MAELIRMDPVNLSEQKKIRQVARLLKGAKNILFITGAGISADSGLPTYRGIGGLYNQKTTEDGIPIEMALAGEMLSKRPEVTWKYLAQIEENCRKAKFNRAHEIISEMEKVFERVWVLTQNIDGFHRQAGSKNVIEIHGDFHKLACTHCGWRSRVDDYSSLEIPPRCPDCKKIIRPQVVFFGEQLPTEELQVLSDQLSQGFDIYFSVGTTSVFPYIQHPILDARYSGGFSVEINPSETQVSHLVDLKLSMGAAEALDVLWKEYLKDKSGNK